MLVVNVFDSEIILGVFVLGTAIGALMHALQRRVRIEKLKADLISEVEREIWGSPERRPRVSTAPALWEPVPKQRENVSTPAPLLAVSQQKTATSSTMTTVVNSERRWIDVDRAFAEFLGYRPDEMLGRLVDDFTVPNSVDIPFVFGALSQLGEMDGIWVLRHRSGEPLVIHYRARMYSGLSYAEIVPLKCA